MTKDIALNMARDWIKGYALPFGTERVIAAIDLALAIEQPKEHKNEVEITQAMKDALIGGLSIMRISPDEFRKAPPLREFLAWEVDQDKAQSAQPETERDAFEAGIRSSGRGHMLEHSEIYGWYKIIEIATRWDAFQDGWQAATRQANK